MRSLRYRILPGVGPGSIGKTGTLVDLVGDIPCLFLFNVIPPLSTLNEVLMTGVVDAGMSGGCKWKPFSIDEAEFEELVGKLQRLGSYQVVEAPSSLLSYQVWCDWLVEQRNPRREITEAELSDGERQVYEILCSVYGAAIQRVVLTRRDGKVTAHLRLDPRKVRLPEQSLVLTNLARLQAEGQLTEEYFRQHLRDP